MVTDQILKLCGIITVLLLSLFCLCKTFKRLKEKDQGFGPRSLKIIGASLLLPVIVILSLASDFNKEAVIGLMGTIIGYLLSDSFEKEESKNELKK